MRGKQATKRTIAPDAVYNNELVGKLINYVMVDGKKTLATKLVYATIEDLGTKSKINGIEALQKAVDNVKPKVEIRARRVGGANHQVPVPVGPERQVTLALRWILAAARKNRGSKQSWEALSKELLNSLNNEGDAFRKREDMQRTAEANRAYAQFSW